MIRKGYTRIPNTLFTDTALTVGARLVCAYIMSNKAGWDYSAAGIAHAVGMSEFWVQQRLIELENVGYLKRERKRDERGRLKGITYTVTNIDFTKIGDTKISDTNIGKTNPTRIIYNEKNIRKKTMCVPQAAETHTQSSDIDPLEFFKRKTREAQVELRTTPQVCRKFVDYWCQTDGDGVMLWQRQRTFDFKRRLNKWMTDEREQPTRVQQPGS